MAASPDTPVGSTHFDWEVAGKGILIHLTYAVVDGIRQIAFLRNPDNREVGGLLVGHSHHHGGIHREIWIEDFLPIRLEHLRAGTALLPGAGGTSILRNDQEVLGYYRTHNRSGGLFLDDADVALLRTHFTEPNGIVLVIRPSPTAAGTAGFFFWEGSNIRTDSSYLEFPFRRRELQGELVPSADLTPAAGSAPATVRRQASAVAALSSWLWLPFLTATLVLVPMIFYKSHQRAQTPSRPASLSLSAQRRDTGVDLTWDRNNPIVKEAQAATLWITDGGATKRLDLDTSQVTSGRIVYWPSSDDLNFRLQVFAPGQSLTESVRAVGSTVSAQAQLPGDSPVQAEVPQATRTVPPELEHFGYNKPSPATPIFSERSRMVNRDRIAAKESADEESDETQQQSPVQARAPENVPLQPPPAEPTLAANLPSQSPIPPGYRPSTAVARVSYQPVDESRIRKVISKVPGLNLLQRHRFKSGDDFTPARAVRQVAPSVPITLRKALGGDEVDVALKVEVDRNGQVKRMDIPESSRHAEFVQLAAETARRWKFEPARLRGKQVASDVVLHFKFTPGPQ